MAFLQKLQHLASQENDTEAERINKSVLILTVVFKSVGCIAWIAMYTLFGLTLTAIFPMIYLGVLIITTFYLYKTKNFHVALYIYIAFILIIPYSPAGSPGRVHWFGGRYALVGVGSHRRFVL